MLAESLYDLKNCQSSCGEEIGQSKKERSSLLRQTAPRTVDRKRGHLGLHRGVWEATVPARLRTKGGKKAWLMRTGTGSVGEIGLRPRWARAGRWRKGELVFPLEGGDPQSLKKSVRLASVAKKKCGRGFRQS